MRIGIAFGSSGTELPGVSSWLVCFREFSFSKILEKLMSVIFGVIQTNLKYVN